MASAGTIYVKVKLDEVALAEFRKKWKDANAITPLWRGPVALNSAAIIFICVVIVSHILAHVWMDL